MGDYIDRDELLKKQYNASRFSLPEFAEMVVDVQDIEDAPAADVAPVTKGWWVEYPRPHYFKCSECKYTVPYAKAMSFNGKRQYNYCPHCGAKMDGEAWEDAT